MKLTIATEAQCQAACGAIRTAFREHGYLRVQFSESKPRSLSQNALKEVFYEQISRELAEDTIEGVTCECKLRFGVPILRRDDQDFKTMYDSALKGMSYENKLKVIRYLPVTSLMNTTQLSEYVETISREYAKRGLHLELP